MRAVEKTRVDIQTERSEIISPKNAGTDGAMKEAEAEYPDISVVIPFYNEEGNVVPLLKKLTARMQTIGRSYEIICVDDGSTDGTVVKLKEGLKTFRSVRVVLLRRNFGQTAALSAGIDHSYGDIIVTMDGDMQNDPDDIPKLLEKTDEGYDIVSGWRKDRKESFILRRLPSRMANWLISRMSKVKLHDYGCTLKAYRRNVAKNLNLYGEMHRFIPALASRYGASITEVVVNDSPRNSGKSKYGIARTYKVILDLLTLKFFLSFFHRPMLFFGFAGLVSLLIGLVLVINGFYIRAILHQSIYKRPLFTVVAPLTIILGVQLLSIGLFSEMMMRTYHESQHKPIYSVREVLEKKRDEAED
jgi:glycosyltransferase involved in cell wall biosynthesis